MEWILNLGRMQDLNRFFFFNEISKKKCIHFIFWQIGISLTDSKEFFSNMHFKIKITMMQELTVSYLNMNCRSDGFVHKCKYVICSTALFWH